MVGVACADCGSSLKDDAFKTVQDHAEKTHAGLPRYRIVKGPKSIEFCADCGDDVTIQARDSSGTKFDSYLDHWDEHGDHRDPRGVADVRAQNRKLEARIAELESKGADA